MPKMEIKRSNHKNFHHSHIEAVEPRNAEE
jgi:hypothetical protein